MFDSTRLLDRIHSRQVRAGVVGLGYVGLPLAVELARSGFKTTGIDLDVRKVATINAGASYIPDVPSAEVAAIRIPRLSAPGLHLHRNPQWIEPGFEVAIMLLRENLRRRH